MANTPEWYDESKLTKIKYERSERGWAIDMGNGTYRLVNQPIRAMCGEPGAASWGDLVILVPDNGDKSWLKVIEKYVRQDGEKESHDC